MPRLPVVTMPAMRKITVGVVVAGIVMAACGGTNEVAAVCEWAGNEMQVDASCLPNDEWPLTVSSGTLVCDSPAVWIEVGGTAYAVNGQAQTSGQAVAIEPIWKENPDIPGARINIAPLHDLARDKCP